MKNTKNNIIKICKNALHASKNLSSSTNSERNKALKLIARNILKKKKKLFCLKIKKI